MLRPRPFVRPGAEELPDVGGFLSSAEGVFQDVAAVDAGALGFAVLFHLAKIAAEARAWRSILAAAYPEAGVSWRGALGTYVAGTGVNAVVPARGGDLVTLYLAKRRIGGASYATLAATMAVPMAFNAAMTSALIAWAAWQGFLPGLDLLPPLPSPAFAAPLRRPELTALAVGALAAAFALLGRWARRRAAALRLQLWQGFAILRDPRRYLREVVPWQAASWALRLATLYWFLRAFGLPADIHTSLLAQVVQSISSAVPLTPAGAGTEQGLLVYVFAGEISTKAVLAFGVGTYVVLTVVNAALGFGALLLALRTLRWRRAIAADRPPSNCGVRLRLWARGSEKSA